MDDRDADDRDSGHDHDHDHGHGNGHDHGDSHDHEHSHGDARATTVGVVTVSTSLAAADGDGSGDESGRIARELLEGDGREVVARLVPDDEIRIAGAVADLIDAGADAVVTSGGTGITPDDVTPEAVRPLFDRELPGFGELFRRRSERQVGTRTILSRATAGVVDGTAVFCLPGSPDAVRLAVEEVVLPEVDHVVGMARR
jgi:molybdenum cofactor biosynthesis protein B